MRARSTSTSRTRRRMYWGIIRSIQGRTPAITIAIGNDPTGSAVLSGTAAVNASGGAATFSGLKLNKAGAGYTLTVSSDSLTPATSDAFNAGKGAATLLLSNLNQTYNGSPKSATVTTSPSGLSGVSVTYDGSTTAPTNAGSYAVVASLNNANYTASDATGTLTINKAAATITLSNLTQTYDGTPKPVTATTSPAGLSEVSISYNGSATPPTDIASYAVVAWLNNANYTASNATGTMTINQAPATITLSNLTQGYDGSPKPVTATTSPAGLSGVSVTYNGSTTAPTDIGSYPVVASLSNANYTASNATGTLTITKETATLTLSNRTQTDDGTPKAVTVTTSPSGLSGVSITYNG